MLFPDLSTVAVPTMALFSPVVALPIFVDHHCLFAFLFSFLMSTYNFLLDAACLGLCPIAKTAASSTMYAVSIMSAMSPMMKKTMKRLTSLAVLTQSAVVKMATI